MAMNPRLRATLIALSAAVLAGARGSPALAGTGVWTPVGPGVGVDVGALVTHSGSPGSVWIGMGAGGVYQSLDEGTSWTWTGRPLAGPGVSALAADADTPLGFWAATTAGVFHTANGGVSWAQVSGDSYIAALSAPGENRPPIKLAAAGDVLYVLTAGGRLLTSADGGATWQQDPFGPGVTVTALDATASGVEGVYIALFAAPGVYLFKSADGARTWTPLPGPRAQHWDQLWWAWRRIVVSPSAVFVYTGNVDLGVLRSADGGATWETVLTGPPHTSWDVGALMVDPRAPRTLWAAAEDALWITRDDGVTWRRRPPVPAARLAVDAVAHVLYAAGLDTHGWISRSADGGATWQTVLSEPQTGMPPARVAWRRGDPSTMAMVVGGYAYLSGDGGRSISWLPVSAGGSEIQVSDLDIDPSDPNRLVATAAGHGIVVSTDGGQSWSTVQAGGDYVELVVRASQRTLFGGGCGIQRSTDRGNTWRNVLPCHSREAKTGRYVQKLEIDPIHPANVYALTFLLPSDEFSPDHGPMDAWPSILWRSADGGVTWKKAAEGLRAFALDHARQRVWAVRGSSLVASDDGGTHWQSVASTTPGVHELLADPGDEATLYATDGVGMFRSRDGGGTWERFSRSRVPEGPAAGRVYSLVLSPAAAQTVYATCDRAVLHLALPEGQ